jgi:hypothetical protein
MCTVTLMKGVGEIDSEGEYQAIQAGVAVVAAVYFYRIERTTGIVRWRGIKLTGTAIVTVAVTELLTLNFPQKIWHDRLLILGNNFPKPSPYWFFCQFRRDFIALSRAAIHTLPDCTVPAWCLYRR